MKRLKDVLKKLPEVYVIVVVLLAGYTPPAAFHPLAIALAVLLLAIFVFGNRMLGLVFSGLFFLANGVFLLAILSELNEYAAFGADAKQLAVGGFSLWLMNAIASVYMAYNYYKGDKESLEEAITALR